jgi:hypothetical protein
VGFTDVKIKRIGPKWYRGVRRHGLIMGCSVTGVKPKVQFRGHDYATLHTCVYSMQSFMIASSAITQQKCECVIVSKVGTVLLGQE